MAGITSKIKKWLGSGDAGDGAANTKSVSTAKQATPAETYRRWEAMMTAMGEDGRTIGIRDAYTRSAWVYGAISIIAEAVARTPFEITFNDNERRSGPLVQLVNEPNRYDSQGSSAKFRYAYMTELLLNGAVIKLLTELRGQTPQGMILYPRARFTAETAIDENGKEVVRRWQLHHRAGRNNYIPDDEIHHDALYNPLHDWEGLAPLAAAIAVVNNDVNISEFANRFFVNDASPGMIFSSDDPDFDQEQAELATKLWNDKHRGVGKAWSTVFLGHGLKPFKIGMGLDPRILGPLKGLTREEIVTGIFKVPLSIFGQSDAAGNQGVVIGGRGAASNSEKEGFLINVIMPWSRRYDEEFNIDIAWRFGIGFKGHHNFDENPILENRRLARAETAAELLKQGVPLNEMIRWLKLELHEIPWGNDWLVPDNMIPAAVLVKAGDKLLEQKKARAGKEATLGAAVDQLTDPTLKEAREKTVESYIAGIVAGAQERLESGLHEYEAKLKEIHLKYQGRNGNNNGEWKHRIDEALR